MQSLKGGSQGVCSVRVPLPQEEETAHLYCKFFPVGHFQTRKTAGTQITCLPWTLRTRNTQQIGRKSSLSICSLEKNVFYFHCHRMVCICWGTKVKYVKQVRGEREIRTAIKETNNKTKNQKSDCTQMSILQEMWKVAGFFLTAPHCCHLLTEVLVVTAQG